MAPVVTGQLRPAGAVSGTARLVVEFCGHLRVLGREKDGAVGVFIGWGRRFWVLAPPAEMVLKDGFGNGAVCRRQRCQNYNFHRRCRQVIGTHLLSHPPPFCAVFSTILEEDGTAAVSWPWRHRRRWRQRLNSCPFLTLNTPFCSALVLLK